MAEWIFGYGSLIWRADFPFDERRPALIRGFARRFWQGSTDHRGVPKAPGRVVTLIEAPDQTCWGMAYRLPADGRHEILDHLDYREKGGYARQQVDIYLEDAAPVTGLVYHATEDNPNYLGEAPPHDIARQIHRSTGPSGHNREYLLELEAVLRAHGKHDHHVFEIADALRLLD